MAPDRERDNVDALIEEVRKLALRGLQTQSADAANDERTSSSTSTSTSTSSRTPPRDDAAHDDIADASSRQSNTHDNNNINQQQNNILSRMRTTWMTMTKELRNTRQKSPITTTPEKDEEEELAFKISKDSDTYKNIFSTVQWYRDSFLIGSDFADTRSAERGTEDGEREEEDDKLQSSSDDGNNTQYTFANQIASSKSIGVTSIIPNCDPNTATAHPLLLYYTQTYLQSPPALNLLHPYATWIASHKGPLYPTAIQSMAHTLIPLGQSSCDWAMGENMLWVLQDEEWKEFAKSITVHYVDVQGNSGQQQ